MGSEFQLNGNIITVPPVPLGYHTGIGKIMFEKMRANKDSIGQIDGLTGKKDSFEAMLQRSIRTAIVMRSKGITSNDVISICSFNHLDIAIPIIASLFIGAKTASTDPSLSLTDTIHLLKQVQPKIVFVSPNSIELIEDTLREIGLNSEIVVFGDTSKHTKFSEFLVESPEEKNFTPVEVADLNETAIIFFSSGTSGMPKGICVTHLSVLAKTPQESEVQSLFGPMFLGYPPTYWLSSFTFLMHSIVGKMCRIIFPILDANDIYVSIEKYKISFLFLSPIEITTVLRNGQPDGIDVSSLKLFMTSGAPVSKERLNEIRKTFPGAFVISAYGQTELGGGPITFKTTTSPEDLRLALERPTSSGRPLPGYTYKIADPETEEILGPNQTGELRIKTKYQMNGYYNMDSSSTWDQDGFLKTGDMAYYDEDFCFYIVDRVKEMLKFQSWQIAPAKLEKILLAHPAIESAVVIGFPHPADGDHPMAIVVLKQSDIKVTPEEIEKYMEERVDDRQRLRGGVKFVERMHLTPTGKIRRKYMKDLVLQGKI